MAVGQKGPRLLDWLASLWKPRLPIASDVADHADSSGGRRVCKCSKDSTTACDREVRVNKIELAILKENWLAVNAVIAFVGALLLGQSWHVWGDSRGSVELLYLVTVPDYTESVILSIMAALFFLSVLLAVASTARPLQVWAIRTVPYFSPTLGFVALTAYTILWVSASGEFLSSNQWWAQVLFWGWFWDIPLHHVQDSIWDIPTTCPVRPKVRFRVLQIQRCRTE